MASALALNKFASLTILRKALLQSVCPVAAAPSTSRLLNTSAVRERVYDDDDDYEEGDLDVDRGLIRRPMLSDAFDPFVQTRSLSQLLNAMEPFAFAPRGIGSGGFRRGWNARETEDGLHLRFDMPGLSKEDVKVSVEQSTLVIKGEAKKEAGRDDSGLQYSRRIELLEKPYKMDQIKAEMKNGMLKIIVPKVREDERGDIFHVNIE